MDLTLVHAREAYREAISVSASHLALVHNHPSGDCSPSTDDIRTTRQMLKAGKMPGRSLLPVEP
ncbi:MAG: JAB domain-containing protein [Verrucomicrobiae bacterium]|nr:JAB domain-containing protein [Verrucomicrobiae bacterium]